MLKPFTIFSLAQALCVAHHKYGVVLYHSYENSYNDLSEEAWNYIDEDAFKGLLNDGVSFLFFEDLQEFISYHNLLAGKIKHDLFDNFGKALDNPIR